MKRCKCNPRCGAEVKSDSRIYARGHSPASHIFTEERCKAISKAKKRFHKHGGINAIVLTGHSPETKKKISYNTKAWMKEHKKEFKLALKHSNIHSIAIRKNIALATKANSGKHRSNRTKTLIADSVSKARQRLFASGKLVIWNKGLKGVQVAWNKGQTKKTDKRIAAYAKKLEGHPLHFTRWKCWYPNEDDQQICMRSSWEVAFACWLDYLGIPWLYEPKAFYIGKGKWTGVTYTPDFYLPEQNTYIEIKGMYSEKNKRKMEEFRKLYKVVHVLWKSPS